MAVALLTPLNASPMYLPLPAPKLQPQPLTARLSQHVGACAPRAVDAACSTRVWVVCGAWWMHVLAAVCGYGVCSVRGVRACVRARVRA